MCFFRKKKKEIAEVKPAQPITTEKVEQPVVEQTKAEPIKVSEPEKVPAKKPVAKKPATAKAPATKPAAKPATAKAPATKPVAKKPATAKAPATKPAAKKPATAKAPATKPAAKPAEKKTVIKQETAPNKEEVTNNPAKDYHVSQREDGKWQVKGAKAGKALKLFDTQAEAIDYAKTKADNQEASFTIHKKDGKIRKQKY